MITIGDFCGNCHEIWPCQCDNPMQMCGICAGSLRWDCRCTEREFAELPTPEQIQQIATEEARAVAISEALNDPFIDRATACELIDELAEIEIKLEKE